MQHALKGALLIWLMIAASTVSYAEEVSPRRLLEVADLANPVISPNGRQVAFRLERASVERNTYDTAWYVQDMDGAAPPRRVADGGVLLRDYATGGIELPAPALWSPDGRWIYYRAMIDGKIAVWRAAADGSRAELVTRDPADVRAFAVSPDGQTLKYSVGATREEVIGAEQAEYERGIRINDSVFIGAGLFRSSRLEGRPATQRFIDDYWFTVGPLLANVPSRWKAVDLATQGTRDLAQADVPPTVPTISDLSKRLSPPSTLAQHPDGMRLAILTRIGEEEGRLSKPDVELAMLPSVRSDRPVKCQDVLCIGKNITDVRWRPGSDDEVLFTVVDRHEGRAWSMFLWNVSTGAVRPVVHSRGLLAGSRRPSDPCGLSSEALVCVVAEADQPPRLEAIDLATGRRQLLFEPNAALALDIAAKTPARLLRWTDERGREYTGWLFQARGTPSGAPPPLFVTFYTCDGFLRGGVGDEWPLVSFAEQGISALCINGNPGYREAVENYGQGLLAVESVVELLAARGEIDHSKVGMGGQSYGSEVTMWTAMHSNVLAAASVSGISITRTLYLFNTLRENTLSMIKRNWQIDSIEEPTEQWQTLSPVFNLEKILVPILFQLSEQEYLMTLDYSLPLIRRHQGDMYVFPDEPHTKFSPSHKLAVYERNVDWFRFWLQGHENADPLKSDQYSIWRQMRERLAKVDVKGSRD
ncbi:Atxe2 family lasso peptide isopeptidase [Xanthomonas hortorum]|uniref:Atxe2 family lasso peptide isopeptidase n=1 Tax=Xanthomonas hortorum pv. hederae TaxID=453603 RepID=A0A9X4BV53_9XANT|nr:Atxe2 family lasso peptide isopeptidase [Xanthomonas hortorum]MCE4369698.1 Atxe2 family lasso peptide isopeptidase [Xanthomonas hortorum pv. hederae]MDC8640155.1 Atxe2 family lasso peptide isopeptidase [Xanthomonas hortorum pv. hederae]PPU86236.1 dipeptidyl aminopeptidase [Xanthomonas hortorum pv. hederae]PUF01363.1 dipeptidyl aminopeptidase [Xanthomonas hortorum pv. hederae]